MWKYLVEPNRFINYAVAASLQRWPLSVPFLSMPMPHCHTKRWSLTPQTESGLASVMFGLEESSRHDGVELELGHKQS